MRVYLLTTSFPHKRSSASFYRFVGNGSGIRPLSYNYMSCMLVGGNLLAFSRILLP